MLELVRADVVVRQHSEPLLARHHDRFRMGHDEVVGQDLRGRLRVARLDRTLPRVRPFENVLNGGHPSRSYDTRFTLVG